MSHRIVIRPAHFGSDPDDVAGADQVVPEGATEADVRRFAAEWQWRLPLRVYTPSEDDARFLWLVRELGDQGLDKDSYRVFVKSPPEKPS